MDTDALRTVNGILLVLGGILLWRQLYWQFRIGAKDMQRKSAMGVITSTSAIMIQYGLAAAQIGPSLATGVRGTASFLVWIATIYWWIWATERHNQAAIRNNADDEDHEDREDHA